jgi:hypothetical protein
MSQYKQDLFTLHVSWILENKSKGSILRVNEGQRLFLKQTIRDPALDFSCG